MQRAAIGQMIALLHAIWSTGDVGQIPQVLTPSFLCHLPKSWHQPDLHGRDAMSNAILDHRAAFADWTEVIHDLIIEGDRAVTRFSATGTHTGPFEGRAATGRRVSLDEIAIFRMDAGQIAEQWFLSDDMALLVQLDGT